MEESFNHFSFIVKPSSIHIWTVSLRITEEEEGFYLQILSEDELMRANKFRFQKDRKAFIASRGLLRILSSKYLATKPELIEFKYSKFGKPFFSNETTLNFNVSHSGEKVVIAFVKEHDIGIDIEFIKRDFDVMDIAENFFSSKEIDALNQIEKENQTSAFFRCWTRKESFIKAEGSGLSFPLNKFSVTLDKDLEASLIETKWDNKEKDKWCLFSFVPSENYIAAIAAKGLVSDCIFNELNHFTI